MRYTSDELERDRADALAWKWAYQVRGQAERPPNRHERRQAAALARQRDAVTRREAARRRKRLAVTA